MSRISIKKWLAYWQGTSTQCKVIVSPHLACFWRRLFVGPKVCSSPFLYNTSADWFCLPFICSEIIKALEYISSSILLSILSVHFRLYFEQSTGGLAFFSVLFLQPSYILGQPISVSQKHFASIHLAVRYVSFLVFEDLEMWWNIVIHYVHFRLLMSCDGKVFADL